MTKAINKTKVFISHSDEDQAWVQSFAKALQGQGVAVWLDEWELHAGELWLEALERALRSSEVFACVITAENARRPNFLFELGAAVGMGKLVVPIIPKDFDTSRLPYPLRLRQFLPRGSPEETARRFLAETAA